MRPFCMSDLMRGAGESLLSTLLDKFFPKIY